MKLLQDLLAPVGGASPLAYWRSKVSQLLDGLVEGAPFLTQPTWYVNAATGNDAADGATPATALRTLAELYRRTAWRVIPTSVPSVLFYLSGDFGFEPLVLKLVRQAQSTIIRVIGATTVDDAGTITGWQAEVATTNTRRQLTDASQDFTAHVGKRIRLTSGAYAGYVTWITSLGGGPTVANIGKFNWPQVGADPAIGDAYVIESMTTKVGAIIVDILPGTAGASASTWYPSVENIACVLNHANAFSGTMIEAGSVVFRGCLWTSSAIVINSFLVAGGWQYWVSCSNDANVFLTRATVSAYSSVHRARIGVINGSAMVGSQSTLHDPNGARNASLYIGESGYLKDFSSRAFFNNPFDGTFYVYNVILLGFGQWAMGNTSAVLCGNSGNTTTAVVRIYNGSGVTYVTVPVGSAAVPGNDLVLSNGAPQAWATLPAIAAAPNNAFMNLYQ